MACAVATALASKRRRPGKRMPAIDRVRSLLERLPPKVRRLVLAELLYELNLAIRAATQDAALDAAMEADRVDA